MLFARKLSGPAILFFILILSLSSFSFASSDKKEDRGEHALQPKLSSQTQACLGCHRRYTPGIVGDWLSSRHSHTIPGQAMTKPALEKRISAENIPDTLSGVAVGCYECHGLNPDKHKDTFSHFGFRINVVVSPNDCSTCHPEEAR